MDIQLIGTITKIYPVTKVVSKRDGREWEKQEYLLSIEEEQYPKSVCFQIFGTDRIESAGLQLNERVRVHLEINSNEYNGKSYNTISCWKVDRNSQQGAQTVYANQVQTSAQQPEQQPIQQQQPEQTQQQENDLPF